MAEDHVLVYASGGDMQLRELGWRLLIEGAAIDVDLWEQMPLYIADSGKPKTGASGRGIMILTMRSRLAYIMELLRGLDGDTRAFAVPVLDTFGY